MGKLEKKDRILNVGLNLLVNNPGSADPVLPVGWCVGEKTLQTIERNHILNPQLLIVVARAVPNWRYLHGYTDGRIYDYEEAARGIVPLKQGLEYIQVNTPGTYRIYATIIGGPDTSVQDLRRNYLGTKHTNLVTETGEFKQPSSSLRRAVVDVTVGEEFFAHEPSEWEKWWVNLWFSSKAKDQCQFRKRRILAYTIQPIIMLAFAILAMAGFCLYAAVSILGGYRGVNWAAAKSPWATRWEKTWRGRSKTDSIFLQSPSGKIRWLCIPFWPYIPTVPTILMALSGHHSLLWLLSFFGKVYFCTAAIGIGIVYFIMLAMSAYQAKTMAEIEHSDQTEAKFQAREAARTAAALAKQQAELAFLQCGDPHAVSVRNIPHPTVHLLFTAIKAEVCRPFSS